MVTPETNQIDWQVLQYTQLLRVNNNCMKIGQLKAHAVTNSQVTNDKAS